MDVADADADGRVADPPGDQPGGIPGQVDVEVVQRIDPVEGVRPQALLDEPINDERDLSAP